MQGVIAGPGRSTMAEPAGLRIAPFEPHRLDAVVGPSLRAWAPVFASLYRALPPAIVRAFYPEGWPDGWKVRQRAAVEAVAGDGEHRLWVALIDDAVAGFVAVRTHAAESLGEITMLAVDPAYQRRGIGGALTRFALARMRAAGLAVAMVETGGDDGHAPARRTYAGAGFTLWPVARYFREL
ncbi:MAG: GNAT family N-acetyltransferase [Alphaproteobacteria bacterium]